MDAVCKGFLRRWSIALLLYLPVFVQAQTLNGIAFFSVNDSGDRDPPGELQVNGIVPDQLAMYAMLSQFTSSDTVVQLHPFTRGHQWRVDVQYQTVMTLDDEGSVLPLTGWKKCVSEWIPAKPMDGVEFLISPATEEMEACFPDFTDDELRQAVRGQIKNERSSPEDVEYEERRWVPRLFVPLGENGVSHSPGVNMVRVRVQVLVDGQWKLVSMVNIDIPVGC